MVLYLQVFDMYIIIANIFGIISSIFYCSSQLKTTKHEKLKMHIVCNISDIIQYALLFSISGIVASIVVLMSNASYVFVKRERLRNALVGICAVLEVISLIVIHENKIIMFYIALRVAISIIKLAGKVKYLAYAEFINSVIWMFYDYNAKAYIACVLGIFSLISITYGLIRNKGKLEGYK